MSSVAKSIDISDVVFPKGCKGSEFLFLLAKAQLRKLVTQAKLTQRQFISPDQNRFGHRYGYHHANNDLEGGLR